MSVTITFTAPTRPLSINEANRMHWAQRRRRLDPWKLATRAALATCDPAELAALPAQQRLVTCVLPFPRAARRDPHNYVPVAKVIVDAAVQAGVFPDDTPEYIAVAEPQLVIDPEGVVTVTFT